MKKRANFSDISTPEQDSAQGKEHRAIQMIAAAVRSEM
jgi:hypothetical protein